VLRFPLVESEKGTCSSPDLPPSLRDHIPVEYLREIEYK